MDKLAEIVAHKRREIAGRLRRVDPEELAALRASRPPRPSFAAALRRPDGRLAVIGEIKRRSPSAGEIKGDASAVDQAARYRDAGVDALSILTDTRYFGGSLDDLRAVAARPGAAPVPPCLRKDFFVHPIQIVEAGAAGASAILLIVRALAEAEFAELLAAADTAGLDALVEVHAEDELERALSHGARLIGVNNRDLATFRTDLALSERLLPKIPAGVVAVSESGIFTGADAARARAAGARAILVGEALMKAPDPQQLVAEFRDHG